MRAKNLARLTLGLLAVTILGLIFGTIAMACGGGGAAQQAKAYEERANTLAEQDNWARAIEEYSQAIELNPESDRAYEGRGTAYSSLGDFDRAIADLSKAIELRTDRGGPLYPWLITYRRQGNPDQAIVDLSKAIGDMKKALWQAALYEGGLAYKGKGLLGEARADAERSPPYL